MLAGVFFPAVGPSLLRFALAGAVATLPVSANVEMEFLGQGQGWTDITSDVTGADWATDRGLPGITAVDRFAKTGTWTFELLNDATNSGGVVGYYSPDNVNCRPNFRVGLGVRATMRINGELLQMFTGELDEADPYPGLYDGHLTVPCTAVDWINVAMQTPMGGLPTQLNRRSDQSFSAILAIAPRQPRQTQIMFGLDTYPYTLDTATDGETMIAEEMQKIVLSELGLAYVKADGTLVFENRKFRPTDASIVDTFLDTELVDLQPERGRKTIITRVQTTTYPRLLAPTNTGVIFASTTVSSIGPGEVQVVGPAAYRDPTTNNSTAIGAVNQIPPVATTDYAMNTAPDGSGSDLTAQMSVVAAFSGNSVTFTITNNSNQTGYYGGATSATKLQCRGQALYAYASVKADQTDTTARDIYGQNLLQIDMQYQNDPAVGIEVSQYLLNLWKAPLTQLPSATVFAHQNNPTLMARLLRRDISDRIGIQEAVSGITKSYFINSIQLTVDERLNVTWVAALTPADNTQYWLLEVVGKSELEQTTVLGYGIIVGHIDVAHADSHDDTVHADVTHGDSNHADAAHLDDHNDSTHADTVHLDTAHVDTAHADGHADAAHADSAHTDAVHVDSHGDAAHIDSHQDTAHVDIHDDSHTDAAHNDSAHTDVAHGDFNDTSHLDHSDVTLHDDETDSSHGDAAHFDNAHGDVAHGDVAHQDDHSDTTHSDIHVDSAHSDGHSDTAHLDAAHVDGTHADQHFDSAHVDTAHVDTAHGDGGHADSHDDTAHGDTVHSDSPHTDVAHLDDHFDTQHGDA